MKSHPQLKTMALAISLCLSSHSTVWAQQSATSDDDKAAPQRVVVTGSNVKRIDAESASPLQVISRQEIMASGAITAKDILEITTSNDRTGISDLGGANSWASGASGASLRNLGVNSTLILINGRRLPSYGFADGLQSNFVNIDSIPASAIDRIEILRDGASAIYGSSAIGGVINIITRKTFKGIQVSASAKQSLNASKLDNHKSASLLAGYGDYAKDGFNVYGTIDYYKRGAYSDDYVNRRLPSWYTTLNPTRDSSSVGSLSTGAFPGNYTGRYPANYPDKALAGKTISTPLPGCSAANLIDGLCRYAYWKDSDAMPGADRVLVHTAGSLRINDNLSAWAEIQLADTKSTYHTAVKRNNYTGAPVSWYDSMKGELQYFTDPALPVGHPNNPYSFPIGINYRFADHPDMFKNIGGSQQYRAVAGLQGSHAGWEWDGSIGTMTNRAHQRQQYYADRYAYYDAIVSGEYKFGQQNPRALLDKMFPVMGSDGKSTESWVDFKASKEFMQLEGGPLTLVLGGDIRHETLLHKSMDNILAARIVQFSGVSIEGSRNVTAAFAELNAPLTKRLDTTFALRADKSGPTKMELIPKANASYMVSDAIKLRASASRGYRAPSLPETGNGGASWFTSANDPKRCDMANQIYDALMKGNATDKANADTAYYSGCEKSFPSTVTPNKNLEPERSSVYGFGVVLQPSKTMSITLDWWFAHRRNEISTLDNDYILAREDSSPGLVTRGAITPQDIEFARRASELAGTPLAFTVGPIQGIRNQYANLSETKVSGIDVSVKNNWNLAEYGKLSVGMEGSYRLNYQWYDLEKKSLDGGQEGYRYYPRFTGNIHANWSKGPWSANAYGRYTGARKLASSSYDSTNYQTSCNKLGISANDCTLGDDFTLDLSGSYTGFKNTELGFNLGNVFNRPTQVEYRSGGPLPLRGRTLYLWGKYSY